MQKETPASGLTLVLNAAEERLMLALGHAAQGSGESGAQVLFAQEWRAAGQGAELLAPTLDYSLKALGLRPGCIDKIALVNGPGSFTGLRLCALSAAALARCLAARQAAIPYLPLLAAAALEGLALPHGREEGQLWALTHARRGLVHAQGFAAGPGLSPLCGPLVLNLEEAAALLRGSCGPKRILGSGVNRNRDFFRTALADDGQTQILPAEQAQPAPAFLLRYALRLPDSAYAGEDIEPLYLRASEAEENLPRAAQGSGQEAERTRARLALLLQRKIS